MNRLNSISDPSKFINEISRSSEYIRERQSGAYEGENLPRAVRLGAFACQTAARNERGNETKESLVYGLIANIDTFAESQAELDVLREREHSTGVRPSFAEKESHLRSVIRFNHAAKELINRDPAIGFSQLVGFVTNMYEVQHRMELYDINIEERTEQLRWLSDKTAAVLNGMRHELGFEQILGNLYDAGIEYEETSEDDELRGVDYWIEHHGQRFSVDVKASRTATTKARERSRTPQQIVWSRLDGEDFNGGFRISPERAQQKASAVLGDLTTAAQFARAA